MKREEILEKLKKLKPILRDKCGIEEFAIFGSVARGENTENSDLDIIILKSKKKDYFLRLEAKKFLEKQLNIKVDIGYYESIRPVIKKFIDKDMINV